MKWFTFRRASFYAFTWFPNDNDAPFADDLYEFAQQGFEGTLSLAWADDTLVYPKPDISFAPGAGFLISSTGLMPLLPLIGRYIQRLRCRMAGESEAYWIVIPSEVYPCLDDAQSEGRRSDEGFWFELALPALTAPKIGPAPIFRVKQEGSLRHKLFCDERFRAVIQASSYAGAEFGQTKTI